MEFFINEKNIENEFIRLANLILLKKTLVINDAIIRFTEIEFYFYSNNHQDAYTHKHEMNPGKWRFHNQGIDITLRSSSGFGGILIRGIEIIKGEEQKDNFINGPRRVLFEIMKNLKPVTEKNNSFGLIDSQTERLTIFRTFRHGLNKPNKNLKCENPEFFKNANYRFIVKPKKFNRSQFSGSEKIAINFKNSQLSYKFLGYNLKQ